LNSQKLLSPLVIELSAEIPNNLFCVVDYGFHF
jgi:hypothetical protein